MLWNITTLPKLTEPRLWIFIKINIHSFIICHVSTDKDCDTEAAHQSCLFRQNLWDLQEWGGSAGWGCVTHGGKKRRWKVERRREIKKCQVSSRTEGKGRILQIHYQFPKSLEELNSSRGYLKHRSAEWALQDSRVSCPFGQRWWHQQRVYQVETKTYRFQLIYKRWLSVA